ncbi:MAG: class I SAM-dependent methyltransferase [Nitrospirae bacterium]|nr:class I SAM-dependent methyltransferase [Nitrospirota bacterium]
MDTALKNCNLCFFNKFKKADSDVLDFEYASSGSYTYYICGQCGLLSIDPLPDEVKLDEAYPENYHAYHPHVTAAARFMKRRYWKAKAFYYANLVKKNASIIELGCSFGDLLMELKKIGFSNIKGIDFNQKAVERAKERGLEVIRGELETVVFPEKSAQLIIMENFIEHVYDPVKTLRQCHSLLNDDGLVAGETPNIESWDYKLFHRYWGGYHTPRHLNLFNKKNFYILAEKSGFEVVSMKNLTQPAHWALSVQNFLQDTVLKSNLKNGRAFYFPALLVLFLPINLLQKFISQTSLMQFVMKKKVE